MGVDQNEKAKRGQRRAVGARPKHMGPPEGSAWIWMDRALINSVAFKALSGNGLKVIFRILEEHMAHAGTQNGKLIVTHKQFKEFGIRLASVAEAIREVEYFGFISVDRGIAYRGSHEPNVYRLTWLGNHENAPATNRWKVMTKSDVLIWKRRKTEKTADLSKRRAAKQVQLPDNVIPLRA